jgi:hypothetical protein
MNGSGRRQSGQMGDEFVTLDDDQSGLEDHKDPGKRVSTWRRLLKAPSQADADESALFTCAD